MVAITRPIDPLGRVVVPMEIRRQLGWEAGTELNIVGIEDGIQITTRRGGMLEEAKKLRPMVVPGVTSNDVMCALDNLIDLLETK